MAAVVTIIEKAFGIAPVTDPLWEKYGPEFVSPPLSTGQAGLVAVALYLASIFGLQYFMKNHDPIRPRLFSIVHNLGLSLFSLLVFVLLGHDMYVVYREDGFEGAACDRAQLRINGRQYYWLYLFLLSKIYEFVDTFLNVLAKRPLGFLHVYHHCITLILCCVMWHNTIALQWFPAMTNLFVHIIMYYYYAVRVIAGPGTREPWWKPLVTMAQIAQFVIDLIASAYVNYYHWHEGWACSGEPWVWIFGQFVLTSFLYLFVDFFGKTYSNKAGRPGAANANAAKKSASASATSATSAATHNNNHADKPAAPKSKKAD